MRRKYIVGRDTYGNDGVRQELKFQMALQNKSGISSPFIGNLPLANKV